MFNLRPPRPFALEDKVKNDDGDENGDQIRRFRVQNSDVVLGSRSERFYPVSFPGLFPFGCGTPNSPRDVQVSLQQAHRHYLLLSDRRSLTNITVFPLLCSKTKASNLNTFITVTITCPQFF